MANSKRTITVNTSAPVCPKTVQELIDNLAQYPMDYEISFSPFTLYRTHDRGMVHFELNEIEGQDFKLLRQRESEE